MNDAKIRQWLFGICEDADCPWDVTAIHGAGSLRRFWRATCRRQALVVGWSPEDEEHRRIADIGRRWEAEGIPVARYVGEDSAQRIVAHEDAGGVSLHRVVRGHDGPAGAGAPPRDHAQPMKRPMPETTLAIYRRAIDVLLDLGRAPRSCVEGYPAFGHEDLRWETWYGITHQLGGRLGVRRPARGLEDELESVAGSVLDGPFAPIHRDFQSTNIHWIAEAESLVVLDWGGARWGPAFYDLVSLLWDPYIDMDEADRVMLLDYWVEQGGARTTGNVLAATAVQRLLQAAGAYAFLSRHRERLAFEPYGTAALSGAVDAATPWPRLRDFLGEALEASRALDA